MMNIWGIKGDTTFITKINKRNREKDNSYGEVWNFSVWELEREVSLVMRNLKNGRKGEMGEVRCGNRNQRRRSLARIRGGI